MIKHTQNEHYQPRGWSDIDSRYRFAIAAFVLSLVGGLGWSAFYHHNLFVQADTARIAAIGQAEMQQKTISDLMGREKTLTELESRQARELADARATIRRLEQQSSARPTL
ncbi:hypothetical protein HQN64_17285 [Enterobacteriaceae bacterium BIT-l23]|uniref:Uncharacterized protein n=1 Tax=Jejubacter calystegiae TaxID=2579935 RepID=A0A4P8YKD4_9ENTR|nr:hypothetical protein [Jejubacter calystegiae]NUU67854.1 hypothetical protein [Enterobacteriaceae bacterium BIT-l23]QCT21179.1 hypothetical protein FEM41_16750 [Jejubacter calystegiae]